MKTLVTSLLTVVVLLAVAGSVSAGGPAGQSFGVSLTGAAESDGGDPNGSGNVLVTINMADGTICVDARYAIPGPVTGAHIHSGAARTDGPVVVGFVGGGGSVATPTGNSFNGCTAVEAGLLQSISQNPSGYYFNIHNSEHTAGAIRGQLAP